MTNEERKTSGLMKLRRMRVLMIIGYGLIVIIAIIGVTLFAVNKNESVMKYKVSDVTASLNVQMRLKLDDYLARFENLSALAFTVDETYTYDATDETNDEYEAINIEKKISDELYKFCLMENFVDYGIVYANNHTVGKVSNGTISLFGNNLYTDLSKMITRERTRDGWYYGYNDDFDRIYYVKRVHENAVFVISFYTTELQRVFYTPDSVEDMEVRLADKYYRILYSSVEDELGSSLPADINQHVINHEVAATLDNKNLTAVSICSTDWYVISSMPTSVILKESRENQKFIYIVAGISALVAVLLGTLFAVGMSDPVSNLASVMENGNDGGYEGVMTSKNFAEKAQTVIREGGNQNSRAMVLVDIDDFRDLTCSLGREFTDRHVDRLIGVIKNTFPKAECIGRIGEANFAILTEGSAERENVYRSLVTKRCMDICRNFADSYKADDGTVYRISVSVGCAIYPLDSYTYQSVYDDAYKALYASKLRGRGIHTMYNSTLG